MTRIFSSLALSQLILLLGSAFLALGSAATQAQRHVMAAVLASILSCFIQAVVFTYLTMTGKLVGQAVHLGSMPTQPMEEVKRLKRSCSFALLLIAGSLVPTVATGAYHWAGAAAYWFHVPLAMSTVAAHLVGYYRQLGIIRRNAALVGRVLRDYDARRHSNPRPVPVSHS